MKTDSGPSDDVCLQQSTGKISSSRFTGRTPIQASHRFSDPYRRSQAILSLSRQKVTIRHFRTSARTLISYRLASLNRTSMRRSTYRPKTNLRYHRQRSHCGARRSSSRPSCRTSRRRLRRNCPSHIRTSATSASTSTVMIHSTRIRRTRHTRPCFGRCSPPHTLGCH